LEQRYAQSIIGATLKRRDGSEREGVASFKGMEGLSLWAQPARMGRARFLWYAEVISKRAAPGVLNAWSRGL